MLFKILLPEILIYDIIKKKSYRKGKTFLNRRNGEILVKYKNKKLEKTCTNYNQAKKELNKRVAEKLFALVNLLENASTLSDIFEMRIYNLHQLHGNQKGKYALDLGRKLGYRLIIMPLDENGDEWDEKDINIIYKTTKIVLVMEVSNHYE